MTPSNGSCALVLTGGGSRAAYQVGVIRGLARHFPEARFDIITGVSAGAINALLLASHPGPLVKAVEALTEVWQTLRLQDVVRVDPVSLASDVLWWGARLITGGVPVTPRPRGLVDTAPLRALLKKLLPEDAEGEIAGVAENVARGNPRALAVTTLDYTTGRTVTWISGSNIEVWQRPLRRSAQAQLSIDHVLASAALPLLFPAVRLGKHWHGDGGIRLSAPLSPALHLGADRILAVSTHYAKSFAEADEPQVAGYPPPAQILGQLMDAIFLDAIDEDTLRLERSNAFLHELPPDQRQGYRVVDTVVIRPSKDLGLLAAEYEPRLPRTFRFLTRSLGTKEISSADFLSLLMFIPEYLTRLMEIGEADVEARLEDVGRILMPRVTGRYPRVLGVPFPADLERRNPLARGPERPPGSS